MHQETRTYWTIKESRNDGRQAWNDWRNTRIHMCRRQEEEAIGKRKEREARCRMEKEC